MYAKYGRDWIVRAPISIPFSISTFTTGLVYSPTMPKKDPEYHPTSYHPVQLVYLMLPGGGRKPFEVYQDLQLDKGTMNGSRFWG
jgi:hypothetical protein